MTFRIHEQARSHALIKTITTYLYAYLINSYFQASNRLTVTSGTTNTAIMHFIAENSLPCVIPYSKDMHQYLQHLPVKVESLLKYKVELPKSLRTYFLLIDACYMLYAARYFIY